MKLKTFPTSRQKKGRRWGIPGKRVGLLKNTEINKDEINLIAS